MYCRSSNFALNLHTPGTTLLSNLVQGLLRLIKWREAEETRNEILFLAHFDVICVTSETTDTQQNGIYLFNIYPSKPKAAVVTFLNIAELSNVRHWLSTPATGLNQRFLVRILKARSIFAVSRVIDTGCTLGKGRIINILF